jgi:3-oxoacyl-[acyl-carrier protein] reductase
MKRILMTHGHVPLNQRLTRHLLEQGHSLAVLFETPGARDEGEARLKEHAGGRLKCFVQSSLAPEAITAQVEECMRKLGGLDALVHGYEMIDEARLLTEDPLYFQGLITQALQNIFSFTRASVSHLIRAKGGSIVFPMLCDSLHYDGYPVSPVLDHAKLSMMKCLSRELMAFGIQVNALTLGYHDPGFTSDEKRATRERLAVYGQKPRLAAIEELLPVLDFLVAPPTAHIGGQNIHVGLGIDTTV